MNKRAKAGASDDNITVSDVVELVWRVVVGRARDTKKARSNRGSFHVPPNEEEISFG